jgi:hypothetical protein
VLEIEREYNAPKNGKNEPNLQRFNEPLEQFKAKYTALSLLKFDPFALETTIALWDGDNRSWNFYKHMKPH